MNHDPPETLFTLEEANALLPQLELILEKMQRTSIKVREEMAVLTQEQGEQTLANLSVHQLLRLQPSLRPLFEDLAQAVQEIEQYGCLFKGLDLGLVDFPAKLGDEIVELCWQYGEKEIAFYHRQDEGFAGRRPLKPQSGKSRYYQ
jgi:hypothetical protein